MVLCLTVAERTPADTGLTASVQSQENSSQWSNTADITLEMATPGFKSGVAKISKGLFTNMTAMAFFINGKPLVFYGKEAAPGSSKRGPGSERPFIPNATFVLGPPAADCDKKCTARISYDFSCNQFRLFKPDGTPVKGKNQLHPRIGELLSINAINYDPLADSLDVSYEFFDNNMEGREAFGKLIAPPMSGSTPASSAVAKSDSGKTGAQAANGRAGEADTLKTFTNLAEALENYPIRQQTLSLAPCQIRQDLREFNRLAQEAGLGSTLTDWIATGKRLLKPDKQPVLAQIARAYRVISNYKVLQLPPIQIPNKDVTNLTFNVYKNGRKVGNAMPYSLANYGGFKVDFSSGVGGTGLIDQAFTTKVGSTTAVPDTITRRNEGNYRLGLVVLSHAYIRTGWRVNGSLTGGFMIDNNIATRYLIGGSLLFGREQRIILTWGKAFGKVKQLDDGLREGQPYTYGSGARTVPTKDVTSESWFVSVSFNLGSL